SASVARREVRPFYNVRVGRCPRDSRYPDGGEASLRPGLEGGRRLGAGLLARSARQEVKEAKQLIAGIDRCSPQDLEWLQKVKHLQTALEAHIREEKRIFLGAASLTKAWPAGPGHRHRCHRGRRRVRGELPSAANQTPRP